MICRYSMCSPWLNFSETSMTSKHLLMHICMQHMAVLLRCVLLMCVTGCTYRRMSTSHCIPLLSCMPSISALQVVDICYIGLKNTLEHAGDVVPCCRTNIFAAHNPDWYHSIQVTKLCIQAKACWIIHGMHLLCLSAQSDTHACKSLILSSDHVLLTMALRFACTVGRPLSNSTGKCKYLGIIWQNLQCSTERRNQSVQTVVNVMSTLSLTCAC